MHVASGTAPVGRLFAFQEGVRDGMGFMLAPGVKGYTQWRKALWTDADLRRQFTAGRQNKWDPRQVAEVIAMFGNNGRGCFPSADVVGERLGCRRAVVETRRKQLIADGWFTVARPVGRTHALDIALPDHVAQEWATGDRSWAGPNKGVFTADLANLPARAVSPDTPRSGVAREDQPNWYPQDNWTPDVGKPPF